MLFIDEDNQNTKQKNEEAEKEKALRLANEEKIKELDTKIQQVKSEIDKNKDALLTLKIH